MTPESFTPEEVVALKKLANKQIQIDKAVATCLAANPSVDEKIARDVISQTFHHEE